MKVTINGSDHEFDVEGASIAHMLDTLGLESKKIAVELNLEIVPKSKFSDTRLQNGDAIEIVQFVGGG